MINVTNTNNPPTLIDVYVMNDLVYHFRGFN